MLWRVQTPWGKPGPSACTPRRRRARTCRRMTEWEDLILGDLGSVQSGFAFKSSDWADAGVPVVKIQNVRGGRVDLDGCSSVSPEVAHTAKRYRLSHGDVLVTMSGEIGAVGIVGTHEHMMLNQRVGRVRLHQEDPVLLRFLGYALQLPQLKTQMELLAFGAAQPNISPSSLASLPISLPPRESQRIVNEVLGAIDDLIENNRRRIQLLERIAQEIYNQWFIRPRIPAREDAAHTGSGAVPLESEWALGRIADLGRIVTGTTPSSREPHLLGNRVPFLTPSDIGKGRYARTERHLSQEGADRFASRLVPCGSICFTCIGSIGKVCIAPDETLTNQQINSVVPLSETDSGFVYEHLRYHSPRIIAHASGAATPIISKSDFSKITIPIPSRASVIAYSNVERRLDAVIRTLSEQRYVAQDIRDMLLPALVTGEIDLSKLHIDAVVDPVA